MKDWEKRRDEAALLVSLSYLDNSVVFETPELAAENAALCYKQGFNDAMAEFLREQIKLRDASLKE